MSGRSGTRVLGVDPGSEVTGYGVVDSSRSGHALVEFAGITAGRSRPFAERLLVVADKIEEVIARLTPDVCAVEGAFYASNVRSALKLGHVRGAVLVAAARAGLAVFEYSPLEVKAALVGYGRAEKSQVQEMVRILLGLQTAPAPHDASDALAVAICHAHTAETRARMTDAGRSEPRMSRAPLRRE
jgi:crossover junction endodeoxyribonuclease RuvC